ncbi:hypothetical protein [Flectobacillus sp. BAB-3569]|uniref:hypothetical protein n=1 Tax=Flectobacillus sp. BAB-3569 TaxID=1509483 RepID=UPI000BA36936|nr:hypothetical protein [Flectobacillus sp. BAB-3569]PAC33346.1 hypothetical protein BWI92_02225 [Flectobacillus sp. BAB-3569]
MNELLANSYFKDFAIPLISVFLTIAVKVVSRKDTFMEATKDDFAIGFDLTVTALILLVSYASKIAVDIHLNISPQIEVHKKKLEFVPWLLFFFTLGLWALSTLVRKYGWVQNQNRELTMVCGVIVPDIIGLAALLFIVNYID